MKVVYCANCGTRLNVQRKAMPKFGRIIDIVEYHECLDEPVELDLTPIDIPTFTEKEGKNKFVQNLNELNPPTPPVFDLRDRRKDENIKSTAPDSILRNLKMSPNSIPEGELE